MDAADAFTALVARSEGLVSAVAAQRKTWRTLVLPTQRNLEDLVAQQPHHLITPTGNEASTAGCDGAAAAPAPAAEAAALKPAARDEQADVTGGTAAAPGGVELDERGVPLLLGLSIGMRWVSGSESAVAQALAEGQEAKAALRLLTVRRAVASMEGTAAAFPVSSQCVPQPGLGKEMVNVCKQKLRHAGLPRERAIELLAVCHTLEEEEQPIKLPLRRMLSTFYDCRLAAVDAIAKGTATKANGSGSGGPDHNRICEALAALGEVLTHSDGHFIIDAFGGTDAGADAEGAAVAANPVADAGAFADPDDITDSDAGEDVDDLRRLAERGAGDVRAEAHRCVSQLLSPLAQDGRRLSAFIARVAAEDSAWPALFAQQLQRMLRSALVDAAASDAVADALTNAMLEAAAAAAAATADRDGLCRATGANASEPPEWQHVPPPLLAAVHSLGAALQAGWQQLAVCNAAAAKAAASVDTIADTVTSPAAAPSPPPSAAVASASATALDSTLGSASASGEEAETAGGLAPETKFVVGLSPAEADAASALCAAFGLPVVRCAEEAIAAAVSMQMGTADGRGEGSGGDCDEDVDNGVGGTEVGGGTSRRARLMSCGDATALALAAAQLCVLLAAALPRWLLTMCSSTTCPTPHLHPLLTAAAELQAEAQRVWARGVCSRPLGTRAAGTAAESAPTTAETPTADAALRAAAVAQGDAVTADARLATAAAPSSSTAVDPLSEEFDSLFSAGINWQQTALGGGAAVAGRDSSGDGGGGDPAAPQLWLPSQPSDELLCWLFEALEALSAAGAPTLQTTFVTTLGAAAAEQLERELRLQCNKLQAEAAGGGAGGALDPAEDARRRRGWPARAWQLYFDILFATGALHPAAVPPAAPHLPPGAAAVDLVASLRAEAVVEAAATVRDSLRKLGEIEAAAGRLLEGHDAIAWAICQAPLRQSVALSLCHHGALLPFGRRMPSEAPSASAARQQSEATPTTLRLAPPCPRFQYLLIDTPPLHARPVTFSSSTQRTEAEAETAAVEASHSLQPQAPESILAKVRARGSLSGLRDLTAATSEMLSGSTNTLLSGSLFGGSGQTLGGRGGAVLQGLKKEFAQKGADAVVGGLLSSRWRDLGSADATKEAGDE